MRRPSHTNLAIDDGLAPAGAERLLALFFALFVLVVGFDAGEGSQRSHPERAPATVVSALKGAESGNRDGAAALRTAEPVPEASRQAKTGDPVGIEPGAADIACFAFAFEPSDGARSPIVARRWLTAHRPRAPPIG